MDLVRSGTGSRNRHRTLQMRLFREAYSFASSLKRCRMLHLFLSALSEEIPPPDLSPSVRNPSKTGFDVQGRVPDKADDDRTMPSSNAHRTFKETAPGTSFRCETRPTSYRSKAVECAELREQAAIAATLCLETQASPRHPQLNSRHEGEKFLFLLSGSVWLYSELYASTHLEAGDSIYFDSRTVTQRYRRAKRMRRSSGSSTTTTTRHVTTPTSGRP
ncbi:hypothetical protein SAMN05192539_106414 [Paraburkholderia diazotrophica]|uniref:Uncharacterized protein n=1 Tax=Paraburkholderia diazotrophica TaxID=667676 RepID=A0A1H7EHQ2_9BURK|nr:hypothetical protein SAMN05192539_106414 [Paraburkholderia diazotrophica]